MIDCTKGCVILEIIFRSCLSKYIVNRKTSLWQHIRFKVLKMASAKKTEFEMPSKETISEEYDLLEQVPPALASLALSSSDHLPLFQVGKMPGS